MRARLPGVSIRPFSGGGREGQQRRGFLKRRRNSFPGASVVEYDDPPLFSVWDTPMLFAPPVADRPRVAEGGRTPSEVDAFFRGRLDPDAQRVRLVGSIKRSHVEALAPGWDAIGVLQKINNSRWINKFFRAVNSRLKIGGLFVGCFETNAQRRERIHRKYPPVLATGIYFVDWLVHRVWPKLPGLRRSYFACTKGHSRPLSEAEALGRLVSCGFEIVEHRDQGGLMHFVVRKVREAEFVRDPTYGPCCALKRHGRGGEMFVVYKLRTMHPYAEFLQEYVYRRNNLQEGGKFKDDFRIPVWGRWLRRLWLDEIPMILNVLRGEMKLVGVRPLSQQYFSLYPPEAQEIRNRYTPGLLPPFYADLPKTFDEIVASELKYLRAYEQAPFRTDLRYACVALWNIFVRRARSA